MFSKLPSNGEKDPFASLITSCGVEGRVVVLVAVVQSLASFQHHVREAWVESIKYRNLNTI